MTDGNLAAAIAAVRQILSLRVPAGRARGRRRPQRRARAARQAAGRARASSTRRCRTVDEGLAQSQRESFFVANLYTVQGEIHEARATAFDADGEPGKAAATDERRAAIELVRPVDPDQRAAAEEAGGGAMKCGDRSALAAGIVASRPASSLACAAPIEPPDGSAASRR